MESCTLRHTFSNKNKLMVFFFACVANQKIKHISMCLFRVVYNFVINLHVDYNSYILSDSQVVTTISFCDNTYENTIIANIPTASKLIKLTLQTMPLEKVQNVFITKVGENQLIVTHTPEQIYVQIANRRSSRIQEAYYQNQTLSKQISQSFKTIDQLYDYLAARSSSQFIIEESGMKFKQKNGKQDNWLKLETALNQNNIVREDDETNLIRNKEAKWQSQRKLMLEENRKLKSQITILKKEVKKLKSNTQKQNQHIRRSNSSNKTASISKIKIAPLINKAPTPTKQQISQIQQKIIEQPLQDIANIQNGQIYKEPIIFVKLTPNQKCKGFSKFRINGNKIIKNNDDLALLSFKQVMNRGQRKRFSMRVQSELTNNWIVLGLLRKQHMNRTYCYFQKNSIVYSGSLGILYIQLQINDIGIRAKDGDLFEIVVHPLAFQIEWFINRNRVCVHSIPMSMREHKLYPFLMLSKPQNSVRININQI